MGRAMNWIIALLGVLSVGAAGAAEPDGEDRDEGPRISYGSELDFNSRYLWRGITCDHGFVMQSSAWVSASDLTLTVWNNLAFQDSPELNELDLYLAYEGNGGKLAFVPSLNYYSYPHQEDSPDTAEIELGWAYPVGDGEVFTTHIWDVARYAGAYFGEVGFSYERELDAERSLEAAVSLGGGNARFHDTYAGVRKGALNAATLSLGVTYSWGATGYLRPHLEISALLDRDLRRQLEALPINVGLACGWEF